MTDKACTVIEGGRKERDILDKAEEEEE